MNKFFSACLLFALQLSAAAQENRAAEISPAAIKQLYVCSYFFEAGSKSADKALSDKSSQQAAMFLLKATAIAIDSGDKKIANYLAAEARADFSAFLQKTRNMGEAEQNIRLSAFLENCSSLLDSKLDYVKPDRSAERATKLYFCANVFGGLGSETDFTERDQFVAMSKEMLARAESVASAGGQREIDPALPKEGKAQAEAWAARLSSKEKAKLVSKIKRLCAAASRDPTQ